jgi:hypothetical protein
VCQFRGPYNSSVRPVQSVTVYVLPINLHWAGEVDKPQFPAGMRMGGGKYSANRFSEG